MTNPQTVLIVGLGNPSARYAHTRHNMGVHIVNTLHTHFSCNAWAERKTLHTNLAIGTHKNCEVILAQPATYMNESGQAVALLVKKYPRATLIVVHDDLDLAFGKIRVSKNSGAAGHNGVKSIIETLGTKDFIRVRVGIGHPPEGTPTDKFVLTHFSPEEIKKLPEVTGRAVAATEGLLV